RIMLGLAKPTSHALLPRLEQLLHPGYQVRRHERPAHESQIGVDPNRHGSQHVEIETELPKEPGGRAQVHAHPTIHPCLPEGQPKAWRGECGVSGAERVRKTQGDLIGGSLVTGSHALEQIRCSWRPPGPPCRIRLAATDHGSDELLHHLAVEWVQGHDLHGQNLRLAAISARLPRVVALYVWFRALAARHPDRHNNDPRSTTPNAQHSRSPPPRAGPAREGAQEPIGRAAGPERQRPRPNRYHVAETASTYCEYHDSFGAGNGRPRECARQAVLARR